MFAITSPFEADVLWRSRNVVWRTEKYGCSIVVKTFCGGLLRSFVYAFRKSKARRSYEHAIELLRRGFDTPQPLGFVEIRGPLNNLSHSCYASSYSPGISLVEAVDRYGDSVLDSFAVYVSDLHRAGIRHDDLNESNVRVYAEPNGRHSFSLIDLNRMKIYPVGKCVPASERLSNICRFTYDDKVFGRFAAAYAHISDIPAFEADKILDFKNKFDRRFWRSKRRMHAIGRLLGLKNHKSDDGNS